MSILRREVSETKHCHTERINNSYEGDASLQVIDRFWRKTTEDSVVMKRNFVMDSADVVATQGVRVGWY